MSPIELHSRTSIFAEEVRKLQTRWDEQYNKNLQTFQECMKGDDKSACNLQRMADNEAATRILNAEFNSRYFYQAFSLKIELLNRVGRIDLGRGHYDGPGISDPPLPQVPGLLEGSTVGGPQFDVVADYLENLAGRLR
jgi:hypothetical protein